METYPNNDGWPTMEAIVSRCWCVSHSLCVQSACHPQPTDQSVIPTFPIPADVRCIGNTHYLVVSACPVPVYLACTIKRQSHADAKWLGHLHCSNCVLAVYLNSDWEQHQLSPLDSTLHHPAEASNSPWLVCWNATVVVETCRNVINGPLFASGIATRYNPANLRHCLL